MSNEKTFIIFDIQLIRAMIFVYLTKVCKVGCRMGVKKRIEGWRRRVLG